MTTINRSSGMNEAILRLRMMPTPKLRAIAGLAATVDQDPRLRADASEHMVARSGRPEDADARVRRAADIVTRLALDELIRRGVAA